VLGVPQEPGASPDNYTELALPFPAQIKVFASSYQTLRGDTSSWWRKHGGQKKEEASERASLVRIGSSIFILLLLFLRQVLIM
jgi:hypothetical protein